MTSTEIIISLSQDKEKYLLIDEAKDDLHVPIFSTKNIHHHADLSHESKLKSTLVGEQYDNIYFIVSILSGHQLAKQYFGNIIRPLLEELGIAASSYHVEYTKSEKHIIQFTQQIIIPNAQAGSKQLIGLLSGDAGINDIANTVAAESFSSNFICPQIAMFPLGTANALANSLGLNSTASLKALSRAKLGNVPFYRATFSPGSRALFDQARQEGPLPLKDDNGNPSILGAVVASWAFHSEIVANSDTEEYRKHGLDRFKMAAEKALYPVPHAYKAKVSFKSLGSNNWQDIEELEHGYVMASLVSNLEKSFVISPNSKKADGILRLVYFAATSADEVMRLMGLAYQNGKHVNDPVVSYQDVEAIKINFNEDEAEWRRICIDGKIIRVEKDGWVEISRDDFKIPVRQPIE